MKLPLLNYQYLRCLGQYQKLQARLLRQITHGRFKKFAKAKQAALLKRLNKIKHQLLQYELRLKMVGTSIALVACCSAYNVEAQSGTEFLVNTYTTSDQRKVAMAMDSDGDFVVVWQSANQDGSGGGIFAQRYNASGLTQGPEFLVNTYTTNYQLKPAVAMDSDGDFVVTWATYFNPYSGSYYSIYAKRYDAAGQPQGTEFLVNSNHYVNQLNPSIAMDSDGDFVITYINGQLDGSSNGVFARRFNASGQAQGNEFQVNTYITNSQDDPSIAMDSDGDFVITWTSYQQDGSGSGIYAQRYNAAGLAQGTEFLVNSSNTNNHQIESHVDMDSNGNFVVTWTSSSGSVDTYYGIYAQRYNAAGLAQGAEFLVNTLTSHAQKMPSVAINNDGEFVIVWSSLLPGSSGWEIYGQRFYAAGSPDGNEFKVNTTNTYNNFHPAVAIDNEGDFAASWESMSLDGSGYGIYAIAYINAAPTDLTLSNNNLDENVAPGTLVGTLSTTDPNSGNTFVYTLASGTGDSDNSEFYITGNNLYINTSPDFETKSSYSIRLKTTDQGGLPFEKAVNISINDLTEIPSVVIDKAMQERLVVYPSPANNLLNFSEVVKGVVQVFDQNGKIQYAATIYDNSLLIPSLPSGIYLLQIQTEAGTVRKQLAIE